MDPGTNDFVGLYIPQPLQSNSICSEYGVNAGIIILNTYFFSKYNGNPVPSYNDQVHLIMHEYGHLSGVDHSVTQINTDSPPEDCNSLMINGQFMYPYTYPLQQKCTNGPSIIFSPDDIEAMEYKGF